MDKSDFDIVAYIEQPENAYLNKFFRSVQDYYLNYGMEPLIPLINLLTQFREWAAYLDTKSFGELTHQVIINDMNSKGYNEIEQFIIFDILTLYFSRIKFKKLSDKGQAFFKQAFLQEQYALSDKVGTYDKEKLDVILNTLNDKTPQVQLELLYCYALQFRRGASSTTLSQKHFKEPIDERIKQIEKKLPTNVKKSKAESFLKKLDLPLNDIVEASSHRINIISDQVNPNGKAQPQQHDDKLPTYGNDEKLSVKDVAKILKYHESHIRRLLKRKNNPLPHYRDTRGGRIYFFNPEIVEWMKSNKQKGALEEAGEIFRRKHKGAGKKHHPRLK